MARPRKSLISKRETLKVALRVCDEEGLEAVSIRRLGRELDVQGISLYHHFTNKEDILIGVCQLALSEVRTPKSADLDWREWLFQNVVNYRAALLAHPNLLPLFIKWHPLRIGLAERNASAGLLAVQGVPSDVIMPLLEALEAFVLGSVSYEAAVTNDRIPDEGLAAHPNLYHLSKVTSLDYRQTFEIIVRATIEAVVGAASSDKTVREPAAVAARRPAKARKAG